MKRLSIEFVDDLNAFSSTELICAIGEKKTMTAQYGCNTCIVGSTLKYNSAFGIDSVVKPTTDNYWSITIQDLIVGDVYEMNLIVNGSSQNSDYYQSLNYKVYFTLDSDTTFSIKHEFYVIDDTNGYIAQNGVNGFNNWFQYKSQDTTNNQNTSTLYDKTKYFSRYLEMTNIVNDETESLLDYNSIDARFYDTENDAPLTTDWTFSGDSLTLHVNETKTVDVLFDSVSFVPTDAKMMLINKGSLNSNLDVNNIVIEDSQVATITNVGTTYTISADITASSLLEKDIVVVAYEAGGNVVLSGKLPVLDIIYGCYPTIEPRYGDYDNPYVGSCIESTPFERIAYGFRVSRTEFNTTGVDVGDCFPLGFESYQKTATLRLKKSDGTILHESIGIYNGTSWVVLPSIGSGTMTINTTTGYYQFYVVYRNEEVLIVDTITAEFEFSIIYSPTHNETVICRSLNTIIDYDSNLVSPLIDYIYIMNPDTNAIISKLVGGVMTLAPTCLDIVKVKVCKLDSDEYHLIPVLRQSINSYEYDAYTEPVMTQLTNSYFSSVPSDFGGTNCAEFYLDLSALDKNLDYELAIIIKKI